MKLIASFITRRGIHQRIRVCQINSPWVPLNTASASRLRSVALFIILLAREPWAAFRAFSQHDLHDPRAANLLIAIFFVLFAGALAIDLLTYWPSVIASW